MIKKEPAEPKNTDGLTHQQFLDMYKEIPKIATFCWYFGMKPEELKKELKKLLK